MFWDSQAQLALMGCREKNGREEEGWQRESGWMLLGGREDDGYSSGRHSIRFDAEQRTQRYGDMGYGDVSCVDALGGESDLGDWGGGDIKCVGSGA